MKTLRLLTINLMLITALATFAHSQQAKDVNVVNPPSAPVNVKSVDDPAKRAFQLAFELNGTTPATTPAGKIFVVEHVSGSFRLGTVSGAATPCKFLQIAFPAAGVTGPPEAIELMPTVMGTAASIGQDLTFISINNPMKFYVRPNLEIGGVNYVMGGSCTATPIVSSRLVLSGYLVDQ